MCQTKMGTQTSWDYLTLEKMRGGQNKTSGGVGSDKFTIYSSLCLFILAIKEVTRIYFSVVKLFLQD